MVGTFNTNRKMLNSIGLGSERYYEIQVWSVSSEANPIKYILS